jgi:hypothetical protein
MSRPSGPSQQGPYQQHPYQQGPYQQGPARRKLNTWWLVSGAAVVVVLIVVAAFAFSSGGSSSSSTGGGTTTGPGTGQSAVRWQALSAQNNALGTWSYGNSLVVAANTRVTAYDQVTGKVLWRTRAPVAAGHDTMFCGASQAISGSTVMLGIGVATDSTGVDSDCHSVISLNVMTGKLGWLQGLPSAAESLAYARSLAGQPGLAEKGLIVEISGQTVVAGWLGVMAGFSLTSGVREWTTVIGGAPSVTNFDNYVVKDIAVSGADTYVAAAEVFPQSMKLLRVDSATGTVSREVTLSRRMTGLASPLEATILSAAPLTVAVEQITPIDATNVVSFRRDLAATRIFRGGPQQVSEGAVIGKTLYASPMAGDNEAHRFYPFTLGNGLLIVLTLPPDGGGQGNKMVAFNDATGTTKWTAAVPDTDIIYPVAVTRSAVEVIGASQSGQGNPELIIVDAATGKVLSVGKPRVLGPAPLGVTNGSYRFVAAGGHVYGVYWSRSKTAQGSVPAVFSLN